MTLWELTTTARGGSIPNAIMIQLWPHNCNYKANNCNYDHIIAITRPIIAIISAHIFIAIYGNGAIPTSIIAIIVVVVVVIFFFLQLQLSHKNCNYYAIIAIISYHSHYFADSILTLSNKALAYFSNTQTCTMNRETQKNTGMSYVRRRCQGRRVWL